MPIISGFDFAISLYAVVAAPTNSLSIGGALICQPCFVFTTNGAKHYQREFDPTLPPDIPAVTDEEIGIALCLEEHRYVLDQLRAAAQLLSSPRVDAARLGRLAVQERCEPALLHIAEAAGKYAPQQEPWATLRKQLPPRRVPRTDALPHWTRLVSHTGMTREGSPRTDWLCRHE